MNDIVVRARDLTKRYRLYRKPIHRFLDTYGLLLGGARKYTEHAAVDSISFEVRRSEKVAIIGRNGAGKSTLLKMICGVVSPTSGSLEVQGEIHALLSLGTGFHPDFTGRENVFSYLAHLGISGAAAEHAFKEIVEFAELHEYIDQPVKTYSAGMGVRLMFSTATVIKPDILVIDEVLGAGDAYFSKKSYERMQELCEGAHTTLLMVTHDLYSAVAFCDRLIWIDRGTIKMDGPGKSVLRAYEESIRDQEEQRLRRLRLAAVEANVKAASAEAIEALPAYLKIHADSDDAIDFAVSKLEFFAGETSLACIEMEAPGDETGRRPTGAVLVLDSREGNWGDLETVEGRTARRARSYGSIFNKLPLIITDTRIADAIARQQFLVQVTCRTSHECSLEFTVLAKDGAPLSTGRAAATPKEWSEVKIFHGETEAVAQPVRGVKARYGQRAMEITDVRFLDARDNECLSYPVGATLKIKLSYLLNQPDFREKPTILVAFQQNGLVRSHRFWTDQIVLQADVSRTGTLEIVADPLLLGAGTYFVTVSVFREGYIKSAGPKKFFTANDQLHDMHSRAYEIVVRPSTSEPFCNDVIFQHPSTWLHNGSRVVSGAPHVEDRPDLDRPRPEQNNAVPGDERALQ